VSGLVAAGVLCYANSLPAPFVFDDTEAIARNPYIQSLWPVSRAMRAPVQSAFAGRPVAALSLAVSYAYGGLSPAAFRAWNLGVLIVSALVLFGIVRRTLRREGAGGDGLAAACALLWLVHPLQTEVVDYVTQRTESMMGLFYLLTLYAAVRAMDEDRRSGWWSAASVAACALGMGCKESMVTAPVLVLLYDVAFRAHSFGDALRRRRGIYAGLAAAWLVLALAIAEAPRFRSAGFSSGVSPWTYLLNQSVLIVRYLQLSVWPHPLVLDYGVTRPIAFAAALPYAMGVLALLAAAVAAWFRDRRLAYLGAWFFFILAPTSSIVPIATEVGAERRMYLPLAAVVVLLAIALRAAMRRWMREGSAMRQPGAAVAALALTAATLGGLTVARNAEYRDPVGIWQTVLDRRPHGRAHYNMGIALKEQGRTADAMAEYRAAVADEPGAHYALGFELGSAGRFDEAAAQLREFLRLKPDDVLAPKASFLLGQALAQSGRRNEAEQAFRDTLRMVPADADARAALADLLLSEDRHAEAIPLYREYLEKLPGNAGVHHNLGMALLATDREADAISEFERAVSLMPSNPDLRLSLGHALATAGRLDEAVVQYRAGLKIAPQHARLMSALALALAASGAVDEPLALFRRALQIEPNNTDIQSDYAAAVARWRDQH
jgi:tetratricopeptide (TPR) repeat protein